MGAHHLPGGLRFIPSCDEVAKILTTFPVSSSEERFRKIYLAVRERICLLQYPPGTIISESLLAAEFHVSRSPIRRVMQRLNFDGLVDIRNGVGTIVTEIDIKTFIQISELRISLAELIGILSVATINEMHVIQMQHLLKRGIALQHNRDLEEYARISHDLAYILSSVTGNEALRDVNESLHFKVSRVWFSMLQTLNWNTAMSQLISELEQTLEALDKRDIRRVAIVRRDSIRAYLNLLSSYIAGSNAG